jgi:hypothetical protein
MAEQRCLLEPYSASPSVDAVDSDLRKQLNLHQRLRKDAKEPGLKKPVLWVLSPGRPEEALADFELRPAAGWPTGYYAAGPALQLFIVVLSELPETAETRLLRLLGPPKTRRRALQEIRALPATDPQRTPLLEILAELRYLLRHIEDPSPEEQDFMTPLRQQFEQFKSDLRHEATQAGLKLGEAKGKAEGKVEGKAEALLAVLAARGVRVTEVARAKILACPDQATLDRWLVRAVTAASVDEALSFAA